MPELDRLIAGMLAPLAMWVLASGLDDLFLDLCAAWFWFIDRRRTAQPDPLLCYGPVPEKKIALLIPAWREDAVIERMLEHNIAAVQYSDYEIFVGVYPNDIRTLSRVAACESRHSRVHHLVCPHDGPTSKADCLNWVYLGMLAWEERNDCRFDLALHHDAEDLIHPRSLGWINAYCDHYDMVQVPVLPLATPPGELTHGVYCDEFAQSHLKELHLRQRLGGFLPSCGVGTAYRRRALDRLAWNNGNRVFQPGSLTEDYHIGLDLHRLGCSQILLDARRLGDGREPGATREYFPRTMRQAIRQRARWIAGIALQAWDEIGWNGGPGQLYWLWRDRKGLLGNPLTLLTNLIFVYGLAGWAWARMSGTPWWLGDSIRHGGLLWWLLLLNTCLIAVRLGTRAACVRSVYGWRHALLSPVRSVWGNVINFFATARAIGLFAAARVRGRSLRWVKTEHLYPSQQGLMPHKRRLGEVLVEMRLLPSAQLDRTLAALRPGERLGEHLVRAGSLSETDLYRALGIQQNLPFEPVALQTTAADAVERLPWGLARRLQVVPVRITHDRYLWVAGPELPTDSLTETISRTTQLEPRFQLITPTNYRQFCTQMEASDPGQGSNGQGEPAVFPPSTQST